MGQRDSVWRRRLIPRVHLSTAVVLMFLAGGWIWVNAVPRKAWIKRSRMELTAEGLNAKMIYYIFY